MGWGAWEHGLYKHIHWGDWETFESGKQGEGGLINVHCFQHEGPDWRRREWMGGMGEGVEGRKTSSGGAKGGVIDEGGGKPLGYCEKVRMALP